MSNPSDTIPESAPEPEGAPREPIRSVVTFTEVPGTSGGFAIGLGLHGARQQELHPELESQPLSIVDILALSVSHIVRTQPEAFQQSFELVTRTLADINARLAAGEDQQAVIADADAALDGALIASLPRDNG